MGYQFFNTGRYLPEPVGRCILIFQPGNNMSYVMWFIWRCKTILIFAVQNSHLIPSMPSETELKATTAEWTGRSEFETMVRPYTAAWTTCCKRELRPTRGSTLCGLVLTRAGIIRNVILIIGTARHAQRCINCNESSRVVKFDILG